MINKMSLVFAPVSALLPHGAYDLATGKGQAVNLLDKQPCDIAVVLKVESQGIVTGA